MAASSLRILHAIHDFLPQYRAGSEIYADDLARTQLARGHHVTVVCAAFDPHRPHGHVHWRTHHGLPVVEITNNWICRSFEDSYRDPVMGSRLASVLEAVQPHVLHVHSLLNLTFDLPRLALAHGARVVATLHDYTLVCPSGGQRLHRADSHVCHEIDTERCARCFGESPFGTRTAWGRLVRHHTLAGPLTTAARAVRLVLPRATTFASTHLPTVPATRRDIDARLAAAKEVFSLVDLFVAPSAATAREFVALGVPPEKLRVSDYGFRPRSAAPPPRPAGARLRLGFVGTPVWHKGVHILIDAIGLLPADRVTLTLVGDTTVFPDYAADLRRRAAGLPVRFVGAADRQEMESAYDALDALVVPSLWLENSPLVIHEALLAGVPVVASNIGGIPNLIDHERNGLLVEAGCPDALATALRRLIDEPGLLMSLADHRTPIKTLDQDTNEWLRVYDELHAARGPA